MASNWVTIRYVMLEFQPSRTALATAYLRAAHQLLDAPPRVLEDPLALALLGAGAPARIRAEESRYRSPGAQQLRAHVVLRTRYAEDRLAEAVQRGVGQYVILGAGLDTFALRQPAWAASLRIVEIDHPNTQGYKRELLARARIAVPANTSFAAIDFERESLLEGLVRHGVLPQQKTFFSWLGVTMYLAEASIDSALQSMGAFAAGSELVLTFLEPRGERPGPAAPSASPLAGLAAAVGEPFLSYLCADSVAAKLRQAGFARVQFLAPEEARALYFSPQSPDFPPPARTGLAHAIR
jgi:methyltransferase (TIGR00027 family)